MADTKYALCTECSKAYPIKHSEMNFCQVCLAKLLFMSPCCCAQFTDKDAVGCPVCGKRVRGFTDEQPDASDD